MTDEAAVAIGDVRPGGPITDPPANPAAKPSKSAKDNGKSADRHQSATTASETRPASSSAGVRPSDGATRTGSSAASDGGESNDLSKGGMGDADSMLANRSSAAERRAKSSSRIQPSAPVETGADRVALSSETFGASS